MGQIYWFDPSCEGIGRTEKGLFANCEETQTRLSSQTEGVRMNADASAYVIRNQQTRLR